MSQLSRDHWLAIGLFALMLLLILFTVLQEQQQQQLPPLTSFSNQPDGSRALYLWLEAIGYTPNNESRTAYAIPDDTKMVLLLEPLLPPQQAELALLEGWVEQGGILLIAGRNWPTQQLFAYFGVDGQIRAVVETAVFQPTTPLWQSPPLTEPPGWSPSAFLRQDGADFTVHGVVNGRSVLLSQQLGEGQLWLASDPTLFTNAGLQEPGSAAFIQNLVSQLGPDGVIWFDDWHRGIRTAETAVVANLNDWLRRTPMGQAIILLTVILFVGLLLKERPFGPPVPLPDNNRRRAPLEYITAMANLSRRAGHTQATAYHYQQRLKRHLARRYRLNPNLPHTEFVTQLATYNPTLDQKELLTLLNQLSQPRLNEAELVKLATAVAHWTEG